MHVARPCTLHDRPVHCRMNIKPRLLLRISSACVRSEGGRRVLSCPCLAPGLYQEPPPKDAPGSSLHAFESRQSLPRQIIAIRLQRTTPKIRHLLWELWRPCLLAAPLTGVIDIPCSRSACLRPRSPPVALPMALQFRHRRHHWLRCDAQGNVLQFHPGAPLHFRPGVRLPVALRRFCHKSRRLARLC